MIQAEHSNNTDKIKDQERSQKENSTISTRLVELCREIELFHTKDGTCFATVRVSDHSENHPLKSKSFESWLRREYYTQEKKAPSSQSIQEAIDLLAAKAQFEGPEKQVCLRVAFNDGNIYVDLGNADWEVVEITIHGWNILKNSPVKFRRPKKMSALPTPVGSDETFTIDRLRGFLNIDSIDDFRLIMAFIMSSFNPDGPFLILVVYGEQGTAKSTTVKVLRALIDPNEVPLRRQSRVADDLLVSAQKNWIVAIDNVSHLSDELSDDLCRLATGGGLSKRALYSDDEEIVLDAKRPIIINGISEFVTRGDLSSRAVILHLPLIDPKERKTEKALWREFNELAPTILGLIFDGVSAALRNEDKIELSENLRMADAWTWATAAEEAFNWPPESMINAYKLNQNEAREAVLRSSGIYEHLRELANQGWVGTPTDLLSKLNAMRPSGQLIENGFFKSPRGLTDHIRRINPCLREKGIEVKLDGKTSGDNSERKISINKTQ